MKNQIFPLESQKDLEKKNCLPFHGPLLPFFPQYTVPAASFTPFNSCSVMRSWIWEPCRVAEVPGPWACYKGTWKWNKTAAALSINLPSAAICCSLVPTANSLQCLMSCFHMGFCRSDCWSPPTTTTKKKSYSNTRFYIVWWSVIQSNCRVSECGLEIGSDLPLM